MLPRLYEEVGSLFRLTEGYPATGGKGAHYFGLSMIK